MDSHDRRLFEVQSARSPACGLPVLRPGGQPDPGQCGALWPVDAAFAELLEADARDRHAPCTVSRIGIGTAMAESMRPDGSSARRDALSAGPTRTIAATITLGHES